MCDIIEFGEPFYRAHWWSIITFLAITNKLNSESHIRFFKIVNFSQEICWSITFIDEFAAVLAESKVVRPLVSGFVTGRRAAAAAAFHAARTKLQDIIT